jgi:hypothetical protein
MTVLAVVAHPGDEVLGAGGTSRGMRRQVRMCMWSSLRCRRASTRRSFSVFRISGSIASHCSILSSKSSR